MKWSHAWPVSFLDRALSPDGSDLSKARDDWVINEELIEQLVSKVPPAEELILLPIVSALESKIRFR